MRNLTHASIYRRLTALYPRPFREEYRLDLLALFMVQLHDEPPIRVWIRALRDLAVTVPTQHLEVRMHRPSNNIVTAAFSAAAASAGLLALVVGSGSTMFLFLAIAISTGAVAFWSWSAGRPVRHPRAVSQSWWKVLLAGSVVAGATFVAVKIPWPEWIDIGDLSYWLVVVLGMTALALLGIGILLAIINLIGRRRPPRAGASVV